MAQLRKTHTGEDGVTRPVRVILDVSYLKEAHRYQIWEQLRAKGATEAELARIYEINVRP